MKDQPKHKLPTITAEAFKLAPDRYELRDGSLPDAPPCPYGNRYEWIGYDKEEKQYVRFTKSVFKRLINQQD